MIEFENCVMCGRATDIPRNMPIDMRTGYMDGAGQLCRECFRKMNFPNEHDRAANENLASAVIKMSREKSDKGR